MYSLSVVITIILILIIFRQVKEAEKFSPINYVHEKLNIVNMTILPNRWRGKRLPEFVIKDLIAKAQAKKQAKIETLERRKKFMASYKPE